MKHSFLATAVVALALSACSKPNGISLSGNVKGAAGQTIYLEQIDLNQTSLLDSALIDERGNFTLHGNQISEPTFFKAQLTNGNSITFIADSAEHLCVIASLEADNWFNSIEFENSAESQNLQTIISMSSAIQKSLSDFNANAQQLSEAERKTKNDEIVAAIDNYKSYVNQYVFENPSSFVSYYALFQNILNMRVFDVMDANDHISFATVATSLNLVYPQNTRVKHLCDYVLQAKAIQKQKKLNDQLLSAAEEVNSPELNLPDVDGNEIALSSLKGKIVILQFWVAEDQNCRAINRQLAKLYAKYKGQGLEIYQVSLDLSKVVWESASVNDKIAWTNVCDLRGGNSIAARLYNVQQVPANFILDRDGSLIGKDLFGTRLDEKMTELFR